jgi:hypothetical protein
MKEGEERERERERVYRDVVNVGEQPITNLPKKAPNYSPRWRPMVVKIK